MTLDEAFPLKFMINLGRRADRRSEVEWQLLQAGIEAERFPAVDARFVKSARGYENKGRYALALTQRLAVREAKRRGAEAVLLLEDDVLFHPNLHQLFGRLEVPDDWGIFYLGGAHECDPQVISPGVVRTFHGVDTHAIAIHHRAYDEVIAVLDLMPEVRRGENPMAASDRVMARLHGKIPTYAAFPNLAWQAEAESDLIGEKYSLYSKNGTYKKEIQKSRALLNEMVTGWKTPPPPKLGLLFLTRGEVNHPEIWREWLQGGEKQGDHELGGSERASGNLSSTQARIFSHPKDLEAIAGGFLEGTAISERHETGWGSVSLVRASLALLKEALKDESLTHFVLLSESCVPVKPLGEILRRLKHDSRPQFRPLSWERSPKRFRLKASANQKIPKELWRFHLQWWLLDRTCALMVTKNDYTHLVEDMFAPDEGYFGTVLALEGYPLDDFIISANPTWTKWEKEAGSPNSHLKMERDHLAEIVNNQTLFARKFPPGADIGSYGLHRPV